MQAIPKEIIKLRDCILWINQKGWSPATSTNYSLRNPSNYEEMYITKSGVDKQFFTENDFIICNTNGVVNKAYTGIKPSAETAIHAWLYKKSSRANCILHTHSLFGTVLSKKYMDNGKSEINFLGYEVQKAFPNTTSHKSKIRLPILPNEQDMQVFTSALSERFEELPSANSFLMAGHGLYVWGENLAEAKRHLEACEFLLQCYYHELLLN